MPFRKVKTTPNESKAVMKPTREKANIQHAVPASAVNERYCSSQGEYCSSQGESSNAYLPGEKKKFKNVATKIRHCPCSRWNFPYNRTSLDSQPIQDLKSPFMRE